MSVSPPLKKSVPRAHNNAVKTQRKPVAPPTFLKRLMANPELALVHSLYCSIGGLALMSSILIFAYQNQRSDYILAVRPDASIVGLPSSPVPNISSQALLNWAKMAVSETFSYNFNDVIQRMDSARRFFTPEGWVSFGRAFRDQAVLANTQTQRQVVTTLPSGLAVINSEGEEKGVYTWQLQVAIMSSIYTGTTVANSSVITLKVERTPTRNSDSGFPFGIANIK